MNQQQVPAGRQPADDAADRVRAHTAEEINRRIDDETQHCIERFAGADREQISRHIRELEREWDTERYLQTTASIAALSGLLLGAAVSRKFLVLPGIVFSFLLQHAFQGWCPPLPIFRRLGVRTRKEINREKYALKALRGDFDEITAEGESDTHSARPVTSPGDDAGPQAIRGNLRFLTGREQAGR